MKQHFAKSSSLCTTACLPLGNRLVIVASKDDCLYCRVVTTFQNCCSLPWDFNGANNLKGCRHSPIQYCMEYGRNVRTIRFERYDMNDMASCAVVHLLSKHHVKFNGGDKCTTTATVPYSPLHTVRV